MSEAQPTPLESLIQANKQAGQRVRRKKARPRDPTKRVEREYYRELRALVQAMANRVEEEVIPVVKRAKEQYRQQDAATTDAATTDGWADDIMQALRGALGGFLADAFRGQSERLAKRVVSMAESETTQAFVKQVNETVGIDMSRMIGNEGLQEYIDAASYNNATLVKNIPEEYQQRIQHAVLGGVRAGQAPTEIEKGIREATGITRRRARTIARDQTAKLTGEITERRQREAGIKYFRWVTSKDERVGSDHQRAAERDVGFGPGVYRWGKPPAEGIPGRSTRPNCRCVAVPVFEWEIDK